MTLIFMFHSQEILRIYQSSRVKLVNVHFASFVILFWMILWLHRVYLNSKNHSFGVRNVESPFKYIMTSSTY